LRKDKPGKMGLKIELKVRRDRVETTWSAWNSSPDASVTMGGDNAPDAELGAFADWEWTAVTGVPVTMVHNGSAYKHNCCQDTYESFERTIESTLVTFSHIEMG
jgi:hypothetical protein